MKIYRFVKQEKTGNILAETDKDTFIIACSADYSFHYGICKMGDSEFKSIKTGEGKKIYSKIEAEINKSVNIPVIIDHYFEPSQEDRDYCKKCGANIRSVAHKRSEQINPIFQNILNNF